jgi:beta-lactam-binding protein with PASTA domain
MVIWLLVALLVAAPQHKTVTVPKVLGLTVKEAEAKLADVGLKLRATEVDTGGQFPNGQIVAQLPGPGAKVTLNYEVTVRVSTGAKE